MIITRRSYDDDNKLTLFTCVIKNHNRRTIEDFNASELLPLVDHDHKAIIELLKQSGCEVLTPEEGRALDLYRKPQGETFELTPEEFDFCVKQGLTFAQLLELRKIWSQINAYEVKL